MSRLFAGLDLGGTSIKAAVANFIGEVLLTRSLSTESHRGPEDVCQWNARCWASRQGSEVPSHWRCKHLECGDSSVAGASSVSSLPDSDSASWKLTPRHARPPPAAAGQRRASRENWRTELLYEYFWEHWAPSTPTLHALPTPRGKYVRGYGLWDIAELYDLKNDPHELYSLFTASEHRARWMQMDKRLFELLSETDSIPLHRGWYGSPKEERHARQWPWAEFPKSMTVAE